MMFEEHEKLIKSCCESFEKADGIIKEVKIFTTNEVIPAVLHLRYAGWHLVKFLNDKKEKHLYEAKTHSENAVLESYRYGIFFCFEAADKFRNEYGRYILPHIVPDYSEKMRKIEDIRKKIYIDAIKADGNDFEILYNMFIESKTILSELIALQPELNKLKGKKIRILKLISIFLPITIAIIVAIIFR